jgi:nitrite reductase/ring-hydroxylating ferredoxin subunit
MARHVVARVQDIPEGGRLLVTLQGHSIGIFHVRGRFYAVLNRCPHKGAQLCRGSILGYLDADAPGELRYDPDRIMLQCPWHGWEYDLETGESYVRRSRIRSYRVDVADGHEVAEDLRGGQAHALDDDGAPGAELGVGRSGPRIQRGPFVAETFPVSVRDDYLVVSLPGRVRNASEAI